MKFTRSALLGVVGAAVVGSVVFAAGHANVEGAVKARKAHMTINMFHAATLFNMAKGSVDFDAEVAQRAANSLHALAMMDTSDMWPAGSSASDVEGTRALAVMWDNIPKVIEIVGELQSTTEVLAANAGTLDGVKSAIGPVGAACTACHKAYRQPE